MFKSLFSYGNAPKTTPRTAKLRELVKRQKTEMKRMAEVIAEMEKGKSGNPHCHEEPTKLRKFKKNLNLDLIDMDEEGQPQSCHMMT